MQHSYSAAPLLDFCKIYDTILEIKHAFAYSGLRDHYSDLFTHTTALNFENSIIKLPKQCH